MAPKVIVVHSFAIGVMKRWHRLVLPCNACFIVMKPLQSAFMNLFLDCEGPVKVNVFVVALCICIQVCMLSLGLHI
jgi:hypothetical protein